jgi:putative FmdB family regulatory protein
VPIYEYRCDDCADSFDILQRMSDDPLVTCEKCGGALRKVLHPVAIHFKGSGFYTTDYGKGSARRPGGRDASADGGESSGQSSGEAASTSKDESSSGEKAPASAVAKPAKDGGKPKEKQTAT